MGGFGFFLLKKGAYCSPHIHQPYGFYVNPEWTAVNIRRGSFSKT
jgi:hypothetical protein